MFPLWPSVSSVEWAWKLPRVHRFRIQQEMSKSSAPEGKQAEYLIGGRNWAKAVLASSSPAIPWVPLSQGNLCLSFIWGNQSSESSRYSPKITHTIRRQWRKAIIKGRTMIFYARHKLYYSLEWSIPKWSFYRRTSKPDSSDCKRSHL